MTRAEAVVAIAKIVPTWSTARVEGFLLERPDEQAMTIQALKDSQAMPSASAWDEVLAVLKGCAELAGLVIPIAGAITGVYGVAKL